MSRTRRLSLEILRARWPRSQQQQINPDSNYCNRARILRMLQNAPCSKQWAALQCTWTYQPARAENSSRRDREAIRGAARSAQGWWRGRHFWLLWLPPLSQRKQQEREFWTRP